MCGAVVLQHVRPASIVQYRPVSSRSAATFDPCSSGTQQHVPAELQADVRVADLLRIANTSLHDRKYILYSQIQTLLYVDCINKCGTSVASTSVATHRHEVQPRARPRRSWRCGGRADPSGAPRGSELNRARARSARPHALPGGSARGGDGRRDRSEH